MNGISLAVVFDQRLHGAWMKLNVIMFILTGLYWNYLCKFYVYGYENQLSILIIVERDATQSSLFIIL